VLLLVNMQIANHKLCFRENAQSKCGTLDYINHIPSGGDKKVLLYKLCPFSVYMSVLNDTVKATRRKNCNVIRVSYRGQNNLYISESTYYYHQSFCYCLVSSVLLIVCSIARFMFL